MSGEWVASMYREFVGLLDADERAELTVAQRDIAVFWARMLWVRYRLRRLGFSRRERYVLLAGLGVALRVEGMLAALLRWERRETLSKIRSAGL